MPPLAVRDRIQKAALALAAVVLSAAVAEGVLRLLPAGMIVEADLYRMSDGLLTLRPNVVRRHVTPQWDVTLRINAEGLRDFERTPTAEEAVVLGLGDSQAFGWGVDLEQTFYARLEARASRPIRLIKAAVPGTGTSDQVRMLERLASRYTPRAVIVTVFVGNDFVDVARGGSAQYDVVSGFLTHRQGTGGTGSFREWAVHSRLLQLLRAAQFRIGLAPEGQRHWDAWMREYAQIHLANPPPETQRAYEQTLAALDAIDETCRRIGARLLLVVLPRSFQIDADESAEMTRALGWSREQIDLDRPQRTLAEWARSRGVAYVDALPAFRRHAKGGGEPLFYTPDAHMTAAGHAAAARVIEPALRSVLNEAPPG